MKIQGKIILSLAVLMTLCQCVQKNEQTSDQSLTAKIITGAEQTDLYLSQWYDKRIGFVVNHTSLISNTHIVDSLVALGIDIRIVFVPEHGFRGDADAGEQIENGVDLNTGIPIISLYGEKRKPNQEDLENTDLVVFDIQDVGTRFYTYISTMHYVMEACAENNIPLTILDRPNPNGDYIDGPVRKEGFESFVGVHPIPVVHGLTVGELAQMINEEGWLSDGLKCDLTVIPVANYSHADEYRPPVKTSPNLPNYNSIRWYPTTCFFEGTVISEGRGTYHPFEFIGYPDPDMGEFSFTPQPIEGMSSHPKFEGETCWGVDLRETTPEQNIELNLIIDFYKKFKDKDSFFTDYFNTLAGTDELRIQIESGFSEEEIRETWQADLEVYNKIREKYLLYPDED